MHREIEHAAEVLARELLAIREYLTLTADDFRWEHGSAPGALIPELRSYPLVDEWN